MTSQGWIENSFAIVEQGMNGARQSALHTSRRTALESFLSQGMPTPHDEEWRYSNLKELADQNYALPDMLVETAISPALLSSPLKGIRIVFVNGGFRESLSTLPQDGSVVVEALSGFLHAKAGDERIAGAFNTTETFHQRSLTPINAALMRDGVAVLVRRAAVISEPIEIVHIAAASKGATVHTPRLLLVVEEQAQVTVVERFCTDGQGNRFNCAVSEVLTGANASCDYYAVSQQDQETVHYHSLQASIARDARFRSHLLPLNARLARNEVNLNLLGSNSHATVNGLTVLNGNQHVDNSTVMRHAVPHCESSQLFKGIYGASSRGVFQGTIIVEKDAQKTNAFQSNQSLLLSSEASTDTKPQLKIWADDVKCTHGATVGQLDEDALFYIKSRGISADIAAALLTEAFAGEVLAGIEVESLRESVRTCLFEKLGLPDQE